MPYVKLLTPECQSFKYHQMCYPATTLHCNDVICSCWFFPSIPTLCHKLWQPLTGILQSNLLSKGTENTKEKKEQINSGKSSLSMLQLPLSINDNVNVHHLKENNPGYASWSVAYVRLMPQEKTDKVLQNVTSCWILFTVVGNYVCKNRLFRQ